MAASSGRIPEESSYQAELSPKLCLLIRDYGQVRLEPLRRAFKELGFQIREKTLLSGENHQNLMAFLNAEAQSELYAACRCVVAVFVGCEASSKGISVSGCVLTLTQLADPFNACQQWHGQPKIFIVQHEAKVGHVQFDTIGYSGPGAKPLPLTSEAVNLPAYVDCAFALGYGTSAYLDDLCDLLTSESTRGLEFNQLMVLLNASCHKRVRETPEDGQIASGYISYLRRYFFFCVS